MNEHLQHEQDLKDSNDERHNEYVIEEHVDRWTWIFLKGVNPGILQGVVVGFRVMKRQGVRVKPTNSSASVTALYYYCVLKVGYKSSTNDGAYISWVHICMAFGHTAYIIFRLNIARNCW